MLVALFAIPFLVRTLGTERFGVLVLAWMVVGYFGLFDMGLGNAITKSIAERLGAGDRSEIPSIFSTGMTLLLALGVAGGIVAWWSSPWLVRSVLKIPVPLQEETLKAFRLLAISIPPVIGTAGLVGVLQAYQRFDLVNIIRVPMGIFTYLGPLLAIPLGGDLVTVVTVLLCGRCVAWAVHLRFCLRLAPELRRPSAPRRDTALSLVKFGGWMMLLNIVQPLMISFDRFLLGALVSATAIAYYAAPYEMVTRLWIVPTALTSVLFASFSMSFRQDRDRCRRLYLRSVKYAFIVLFPIVLVVVTFAGEGMSLWMGNGFSAHSHQALQWLAAGVFVNSLAHIPSALITGTGRPAVLAVLLFLELPVYFGVAWFLVERYGINGMAMAWTLRVTIDNLVIFLLAERFTTDTGTGNTFAILATIFPLGIFALAALLSGLVVKIVFLGIALSLFSLVVWRWLLLRDEKAILFECLGNGY